MAIYTRGGDDGSADLAGGRRVRKGDGALRAMGDLDELTAAVALCMAAARTAEGRRLAAVLAGIQDEVMQVGAVLARVGSQRGPREPGGPGAEGLERLIDAAEAELDELNTFILPGGCELACRLHMARTVCRRAERQVVAWADAGGAVGPETLAYLNRLGDTLFVLARLANRDAGVRETVRSPAPRPRREDGDA